MTYPSEEEIAEVKVQYGLEVLISYNELMMGKGSNKKKKCIKLIILVLHHVRKGNLLNS